MLTIAGYEMKETNIACQTEEKVKLKSYVSELNQEVDYLNKQLEDAESRCSHLEREKSNFEELLQELEVVNCNYDYRMDKIYCYINQCNTSLQQILHDFRETYTTLQLTIRFCKLVLLKILHAAKFCGIDVITDECYLVVYLHLSCLVPII